MAKHCLFRFSDIAVFAVGITSQFVQAFRIAVCPEIVIGVVDESRGVFENQFPEAWHFEVAPEQDVNIDGNGNDFQFWQEIDSVLEQ